MKENKYTGEYVNAFLSKDAFIPDPQGNPIQDKRSCPEYNRSPDDHLDPTNTPAVRPAPNIRARPPDADDSQ